MDANAQVLRTNLPARKIGQGSPESQSKPGIEMLDPEPCKEIQRRLHLFMAGIVPY